MMFMGVVRYKGAAVLFAVWMLLMTGGTVRAAYTGNWLLHAPIPVELGRDVFDFLGGDFNGDGYRDMIAVKKRETETGRTEVHVLNGESNFQSFLLQTGTALANSYDVFDFALGDYNGDGTPDLYAIKTRSTDSKRTEVHILDGSSRFQRFSLHVAVPIAESHGVFKFVLGDYNGDGAPDLYAVKLGGAGAKHAELHILDGSRNFQGFLLQTEIPVESVFDRFSFALADYNRDGRTDLYAIKRSYTGTRRTEVHVLDGAGAYRRFLLQTGTRLEQAKDDFLFDVGEFRHDGANDLYAIKVRQTETGRSEIHVLSEKGVDSGVLQNVAMKGSAGIFVLR